MANTLGAAAQIAGQTLRFGWYLGLNRVVEVRSRGRHPAPPIQPTGYLQPGTSVRTAAATTL